MGCGWGLGRRRMVERADFPESNQGSPHARAHSGWKRPGPASRSRAESCRCRHPPLGEPLTSDPTAASSPGAAGACLTKVFPGVRPHSQPLQELQGKVMEAATALDASQGDPEP